MSAPFRVSTPEPGTKVAVIDVPAVFAVRTSSTPSRRFVIVTVSEARFALSMSTRVASTSAMRTDPAPSVNVCTKFAPSAPELSFASRSSRGASSTTTIVMLTVSVSDCGPPAPVEPRSPVVIVTLAGPS